MPFSARVIGRSNAGVSIVAELNIREALSLLNAMERSVTDLRPVWHRIVAPDFAQLMRQRFESNGRRGSDTGAPWKRLSSVTVKLRERNGHGRFGPNAILRDIGRLFRSLVFPVGPDAIRTYTPYTFTWGTAVPYAKYHETGFPNRNVFRVIKKQSTTTPARPPMPERIPANLRARWARSIANHVLYRRIK